MTTDMTCTARAADWTNLGGNAGRNGVTTEIGPDAATDLAWTYTARERDPCLPAR